MACKNELLCFIEVWLILVYAVYILLMHYMHTFKKICLKCRMSKFCKIEQRENP